MTTLLSAKDFDHLDIPTVVEEHTSTRLSYRRTQYTGACPYDDCDGDTDGFIVWDQLSKHGKHYMCRTCRRTGDIVKLIQDIKEISFKEACELLEIGKDLPTLNKNKSREERERKRKEAAEKERAVLASIARSTQRGLQHERAQAYLQQRGIPLEIARLYGLCYIPPLKGMSEEQKAAWRDMRQWTDRIIFPLSDGGFTGRALFLWQPGMDENEHKEVLDRFNDRVKAHNKRVKAQKEKNYKDEIPRWYTTATEGYFHGEALTCNEHVTVVEGPFDALAGLAAGILDIIPAGRNGINSDHIPVNVCSATIGFDGDSKGKGGATDTERTFRRKGIQTVCCPAPDDGVGLDWSERYRRAGVDGLAPLLSPAASMPGEEEITPPDLVGDSLIDEEAAAQSESAKWQAISLPLCATCVDMGLEVEALSYSASDGFMYCPDHHPEPQSKRITYLDDGILPPVRMFEGYSHEEYMQYIVNEKLEEIERTNREHMRQMQAHRRQKVNAA